VIPLMTCSARLPVYALLLGFLFHGRSPWLGGLALASLYLAALMVGALAASVLNRILPRDEGSLLLMELPLYRRPRIKVVIRQAFTRTQGYLKRAAPIILVIATLMWVGTNFPNFSMQDPTAKLEQSYAGRAGHWLEPIVKPMGADWRVGVGLISAFAAREVFVSTLAITFRATDPDEAHQQNSLLKEMQTARRASDGALVFTPSSVVGLILFFMIALQCMSTFAVAQREMGSWSFAFLQLVAFNILAYAVAVGAVSGLRFLGMA
jgi:ferrous iron transport protein B